ncbi:hypothetical protein D3C71_1251140 [compost metagenome]
MDPQLPMQPLGEPPIEPLLDFGGAWLPRQDLEEDEVAVPAAGLVVGVIDEGPGRQGLQDLELVLRRHIKHLHQGLVIEIGELLQARVTHPLAHCDAGQRHGLASSRAGSRLTAVTAAGKPA